MCDADSAAIERLFHLALELPPADRPAFVAEHATDPALRAQLLELLAADADPLPIFQASPEELAGAIGLTVPETGDLPGEATLDSSAADVATAVDSACLTGRTIGPYRILDIIGRGGMGIVYRAFREDLGNHIALKVVRGALGDPGRLARFRQEQRVLARLDHERIARLLDAGLAADETPYLVMEYVEGQTITEWCASRGLGIEDRLGLVLEVCDAIAFAHRNLVVHRDLKPSNVLITPDGHVKLLDFGVAKLLEDSDDDPALTATGARVLSPDYAAPEQVIGEPVTTATDIYGIGTLLYELLTGERPRTARNTNPTTMATAALEPTVRAPSSAIRRTDRADRADSTERIGAGTHSHVPPVTPHALARRLAGDLDAICLRALERDPARRYASVELLRDDIVRHLAGLPVSARLPTPAYRLGKFVRRHSFGVTMAAALTLLLATGIGAVIWQARAALRARAEAEALSGFLVEVFDASDPMEALGQTITARDLLERGRVRADRLEDRPEVQARLLDAMAHAYLALGDYALADSLAERSLARERELHGQRHADFAASLATLGRIRRGQGRETEAATLFREALALRRDLLGERHDLTTGTMLELASTIQQSGSYDEAESLALEARAARVARHGAEHETVAEADEALALVLWNAGRDLPRAEHLFRNALALRERLWGEDDPRLEVTHTPLSAFLPFVQKAPEAESLARRALEIRRRVFGDDHPMVAHQLHNVARALEAQGRPGEARALYREMLRRYRSAITGDHHLASVALNNVSATYYAEAALDSAEHYLRQSLQMTIRLYGTPDANVALRYHNLGSLLRAQGRLAEAEPAFAEAYSQRNELYGAENPIALRTGAAYADLLAARGKLDEAEPLLRRILALQENPEADDIPADAARTMGYLARVLTIRGNFAEAESLYLPALETARTHLPATHPRRRELVAGLIDHYNATSRTTEAERLRREEQEFAR
jgi:serine/threonine-protein kinase